ncbi:transglutaminase domain-containing protein [Paenibacillus sp. Marseille-Q4541]|uniref:transglutaminase domain-containing protein n=1 Tax=Paenibacillus sp. Marseille-Q4541 TaxID=2831522 RepID=UPI001BA86A3A|nr:transglutaminase domain-containing protein [Paenibacillus sp. Marseille-Q4541]
MTTLSAYGLDTTVLERKFEEKRALGSERQEDLFDIFNALLSEEEEILLKFLYAYMPVHDMADYDGVFFLNHVRKALQVRKEMPWGAAIPNEIFLHFVLPYRVNNENIDDSRSVIYEDLKGRVSSLGMKEAVLETNYWCHEKATYVGSDMRTVSPLTLMRTALGRCGEQSTLAVTALRSIGIPARQCYTPRWVHCDSNHAWVEAWTDGEWHFLGACEPEPMLDEGWFRAPAQRAMLVNTRVAADYHGPEEVCSRQEWYEEINMLDRYASTRRVTVLVTDEQGKPLPKAEVHFQVYNSAEFFSIATLMANEEGRVSLTTGYGDLILHGKTADRYGWIKASVRETADFELRLSIHHEQQEYVEFDLVPPPAAPASEQSVLAEQQAKHDERLREGTEIRTRFEEQFISAEQAARIAEQCGLPEDRVQRVLQLAKGNGEELASFLKDTSEEWRELALRLLESLRDKDLADSNKAMLEDHLKGSKQYSGQTNDAAFFDEYVLCPRVYFEMLAPYRTYFQQQFTEMEQSVYAINPKLLADRIDSMVKVVDGFDRYPRMATPAGAYRLKVTDSGSRDILFVAAARSIGIPARLEPHHLDPEYMLDGEWKRVYADVVTAENDFPKGAVRFIETEGAREPASYFENVTLARLEEGVYQTLNMPYGEKDLYDKAIEVMSGEYRLTTGVRLSDGSVKVRLEFFTVHAGQEVQRTLIYRYQETEVPVIGHLTPELFPQVPSTVGEETISNSSGLILAWMEPEREPTKHLLRELRELRAEMEAEGAQICLYVQDEHDNTMLQTEGLPAGTCKIIDPELTSLQKLAKRMGESFGLRGTNRPVVLYVDQDSNIRYFIQGYKLGIVKELIQTMQNLKVKN